jgi:hypothetical protein
VREETEGIQYFESSSSLSLVELSLFIIYLMAMINYRTYNST